LAFDGVGSVMESEVIQTPLIWEFKVWLWSLLEGGFEKGKEEQGEIQAGTMWILLYLCL